MGYIKGFIGVVFGIVVAVIAFFGLAMTKGFFADKLNRLPPDPSIYFIALIVLGLLMIFLAAKRNQGF